MSEEMAIQIRDVGKMYKIFPSRFANLINTLGLGAFGRADAYREFWALRHIDLEVPRGERVGIIGCNGAGKSTLLKLITGNIPVTEGTMDVRGSVRALMNTGAGFHPEFTGRDNVEASLISNGVHPKEVPAALEEITEFTELEAFLDQPFKTYSAGMAARLTFATATSIRPDILIIDEILGAGDGYFVRKCMDRMQRLVDENNATVLLVTHALGDVTRLCSKAIWVDRGRIVERGPAMEVTKAYQHYLRVMSERRLKARNTMRQSNEEHNQDLEVKRHALTVRLVMEGSDARCDIAEVALRENGVMHEVLRVGDAQDTNTDLASYVAMADSSIWGPPQETGGRQWRELTTGAAGNVSADLQFSLYTLSDDARHSVELTFKPTSATALWMEIWHNGEQRARCRLPEHVNDWTNATLDFEALEAPASEEPAAKRHTSQRATRRWPSEGSLLIEEVSILGANGLEQYVFTEGSNMAIRLGVRAARDGDFRMRPVITLYRLDGVVVSKQAANEPFEVTMQEGDVQCLTLQMPSINLGAGEYVFSVALFADQIVEEQRYDLIDRGYEFEVASDLERLQGVIFHHPARWTLEQSHVGQPA